MSACDMLPKAGAARPGTAWIAVWGVLLLAEIAKHFALFSIGQAQPWGDSTVYWRMGAAVANGDWWLANDPVAYRTPGYPWYLGLCRQTFGTCGLFAAVAGQHLCVLLTSLATAGIVWQFTRSRWNVTFAWGMCVVSTARPLYANWLLTESLATLLLTLTVFLLVLACRCGCWKRMAFAGFVLGVGLLVRPALVAATPALLFVGCWLSGIRTLPPGRRALLLFAGPVVLSSVLLPWCLRNQLLFGRLTLCAFTGRELWTASFSPWPGGELEIPHVGTAAELRERIGGIPLDLKHQWSVSAALRKSGLNDAEIDALMEHVAWQAVTAQPQQTITRAAARCLTFWYCWEWETETTNDPPAEQLSGFYANQFRWHCPVLQPLVLSGLRFSPERWYVTSIVASCATWIGVALLFWTPSTRLNAAVLILVLATTTILTAALEIPLYRYRCVLEPLMIAAVVSPFRRDTAD